MPWPLRNATIFNVRGRQNNAESLRINSAMCWPIPKSRWTQWLWSICKKASRRNTNPVCEHSLTPFLTLSNCHHHSVKSYYLSNHIYMYTVHTHVWKPTLSFGYTSLSAPDNLLSPTWETRLTERRRSATDARRSLGDRRRLTTATEWRFWNVHQTQHRKDAP